LRALLYRRNLSIPMEDRDNIHLYGRYNGANTACALFCYLRQT
jgi:hypothetical protein